MGDHAAGERIAQEDIRVPCKGGNPFLDTRAAGIVQANHRSAIAHGQIHDLANLLGVGLGERAAEHGEVLGKHVDETAIDAAKARDEAVASGAVLLSAEIHATVADKLVELFKSAFIEKQMNAFAGGKLTSLVLALAAFRAATGLGFRGHSPQLLHAVGVGRGLPRHMIFFSQDGLRRTKRVLERRSTPRDAWPAKPCREEGRHPEESPRQ
jgi:hypothetical protein